MRETVPLSLGSAEQPIAVIMSVYRGDNSAQLREALNSIQQQSIEDTKLIRIYLGVDGPVSENIRQVLLDFENSIYKLMFFSENRGLAFVLNDLIDVLEDEDLVFRMDSDDVSHPDRFSKQIAFLQKNPNVDIVGTSITEQQSDGTSRIVHFPSDHKSAVKHMCWRTPLAHPTACIRRTVFRELGGYPTDSLNEDIALWFKAANSGFVFANITEPLLYFNVSENFWKRRGVVKAIGEFQCYFSGVYKMHGLSYRLVLPLIRLLFRMCPRQVLKLGYLLRAHLIRGS
jgi:glycosyltransferase involved in cell wall biosynthesis